MDLNEMFRHHSTLRGVIESVLEGELGEVSIETADEPRAARLQLGCYTIFAGNAGVATQLIESVEPPAELIVPDEQSWRDAIFEIWGARLEGRPMRTYSSSSLDEAHLERLTQSVPAGYRIERFEIDQVRQLDTGLAPHALQVYRDAAHFIERGFGFAVMSGSCVVAASTTYAVSSRRAEVTISTREDHRCRGLASAVAARMLLHCVRLGKTPEWSASNPISKRLALRLGYRPAGLCDVRFLGESSMFSTVDTRLA